MVSEPMKQLAKSLIVAGSLVLLPQSGAAQFGFEGFDDSEPSLEEQLAKLERKVEFRCKEITERRTNLVGYRNTLSLVHVNYSIAFKAHLDALKRTGDSFNDEVTALDDRRKRWLERWGRAKTDVDVSVSLIETWEAEKNEYKEQIKNLKDVIDDRPPPREPGGGDDGAGDGIGKELDEAGKGLDEVDEGVKEIGGRVTKLDRTVPDVVREGEEITRLLQISSGRIADAPPGEPGPQPENDPDLPDFAALFTKFWIDGGVGYQRGELPGYQLGITSLGTNLTPLHDFSPDVDGIKLDFGLNVELPGPGGDTAWTGRIGGAFSKIDGKETETISAFAPGQLPTYIDLSGLGGFAFNQNSLVRLDVDATRFDVNGEVGLKKPLGDAFVVRPNVGAFYRHSRIDYDVTMDTDFRTGRFFNTLNERVRLNQFGADVGLDLTYQPNRHFSFTLGGHAGLAFTDASYTGRDCGDGSLATPGCDGTLFANAGVSRGRNSIDPFAGVKAAIGIYLFCRENPVPVAAAVLNAAARALADSCITVSAEGTYDVVPDVAIDRPTTLGGPSVGLSGEHSDFGAVMGRATIPF